MEGWKTIFLLGFGLFSGAFAVSFREGKTPFHFQTEWNPGIPTTIKTMGVNITTIVYLRVLIIQIGSTIILMVVEAQGKPTQSPSFFHSNLYAQEAMLEFVTPNLKGETQHGEIFWPPLGGDFFGPYPSDFNHLNMGNPVVN